MTHPRNNRDLYDLLVRARNSNIKPLIKYLKGKSFVFLKTEWDLIFDDIVNLCKALEDNTSVTQLDFSSSRITDADLTPIAELLENNNTICSLILHNNPIGKDREAVARLSTALQVNKSLTLLNILYCSFTRETLSPLLEAIRHSRHRDMSSLTIYAKMKDEPQEIFSLFFETQLKEALRQNKYNLIFDSNKQLKQENKELKSGKAPILHSFLHNFSPRELLGAVLTTGIIVGVGVCHTYNQLTK